LKEHPDAQKDSDPGSGRRPAACGPCARDGAGEHRSAALSQADKSAFGIAGYGYYRTAYFLENRATASRVEQLSHTGH